MDTPMTSLRRLAAASLVAVAIQACSSASLAAGPPRNGPSAADAAVASVVRLDLTVATRYCAGGPRRAALALSDGDAFWTAFPKALDAPELRGLKVPLIAIAYDGVYPVHITGNTHMTGPPKDPPGTFDVCVETADGSSTIVAQPFIVYGEIPEAGSVIAQP